MSVEVHLREQFQRDGFDVYFIEGGIGNRSLLVPTPKTVERIELNEVTASQDLPSLFLPTAMLDALVAKATGVLKPTAATQAHLEDAVKVRDRLLDMVWRAYQ